MGSLYSGTSVSGYNSNPPPDDGSTGANNQITWAGIKSKLGDPLNTFAAAVNTNITNAFNKTLSGASVVKTAVSYPASAADQGRIIVATSSAITVTTPDATSVLSPFVFTVNNQSTGNITVAGFSAQTIDGSNTVKLGASRGIILWTDGSNWFSSGLVQGNLPLSNPGFGFDSAINLQLNVTTGANALTIAVKANDGTDPSSTNPVLIPFHNPAGSTSNTSPGVSGVPKWDTVQSALSITVPSGQTLGTANSVPFRFWIVAMDNAGVPELAVINCVVGGASPTQIFPIPEHNLITTSAIGSAASAGVFYSTTARTSFSFRIIGFLEFAAGLATAGTYTGTATSTQLFGPGMKKPGDIVQSVYFSTSSGTTSHSNAATSTNLTANITPTSTSNLVYATASGSMLTAAAGTTTGTAQIYRGSTAIGSIAGESTQGGSINLTSSVSLLALDSPQSVSSTTYVVKIVSSDNTNNVTFPSGAAAIKLDEIQV